MIKKVFTLLASLALLIVPLVTQLTFPSPAYAIDVSGFVKKIWEARPCITNVDCLLSNAVISLANNGMLVLIGVTLDDLTEAEIGAMMNGDWNTGLAFVATGAIDGAYLNPPGLRDLHFASHLRHELSDNLLTGKAAYATTGESILHPIEEVWGAIRNVAYGFFMLIMVAIGFMIMLRKQIAPRVIISFTNALPRIVMSLILITVSFSLIALAFDVVGVFGSRVLTSAEVLPPLPPSIGEIPVVGGFVERSLGTGAGQLIGESLYGILKPFLDLDPAQRTAAQALQALLVSFTFIFLLSLAAVGVAIQLVFRIAKLLIKTVLSPIIFLIGSLPGQEGSVTNFAKGIIADCAAFPAVAFMFMVTRLFLRAAIVLTLPPGESVQAFLGTGLVTLFLTIIFMVMTMAAPMFVGRLIEGGKK